MLRLAVILALATSLPAAAAEAARKEREALEMRAAKAADKGQYEKADELQLRAATVEAAPVVMPAPAAKGIALTELWDFEIIDPAALPREYLMPDLQKIRAVVKALKGATAIGGVRAYSRTSVSARGLR